MPAQFLGIVGPVSLPDPEDTTVGIIEIPRVMPISDSQAIVMWIDYGDNSVTGNHAIWGCLATVTSSGISVGESVELFDAGELTFSNLCISVGPYVVAQISHDEDQFVDDVVNDNSHMIVVASDGTVPYIVNDYDWKTLIPITATNSERFGTSDAMAYNSHLVEIGEGEILITTAWRVYPDPYNWGVGKLYLSEAGDLTFLDMGTAPWVTYPEAAIPLADGRVAIFDDDGGNNVYVIDSPVGATSFTYTATVDGEVGYPHYLSYGAEYDRQLPGFLDSFERFTVDDGGDVVYDSPNAERPNGGLWQEFNNSATLSYIHAPVSGERYVVGTSLLPDTFDEDTLLIYNADTYDETDVGDYSPMFGFTEGFGYFGYTSARFLGTNILLIAATSAVFDGRTTADPYGALYLIAFLVGDLPNLAGAFDVKDRVFWRPRQP